jgi:hypothetical protein
MPYSNHLTTPQTTHIHQNAIPHCQRRSQNPPHRLHSRRRHWRRHYRSGHPRPQRPRRSQRRILIRFHHLRLPKTTWSADITCPQMVSPSSRNSMRFTLAQWAGLVISLPIPRSYQLQLSHPKLEWVLRLTSHRCPRPYIPLVPHPAHTQRTKPIRQRAPYTHSPRNQKPVGRL